MRRGAAASIAVFALILSIVGAARAQFFNGRYDIGESDFIPAPRLIQPSTNVVDLRGRDGLEFIWSPHEGDAVRRDYYDFRLYKGGQALGPSRVYATRIPPRQWSLWIGQEMFDDRTMYTCTIRQVYTGSAKSRRTYWSFTVIKR